MTFTPDDIRRHFDDATFARGLDYSRRGMVLAVERLADGRIRATVRGSSAERYHLRVRLDTDNRGRLARITGTCDCPVGHNCKHVVAALLALAGREARHRPAHRADRLPEQHPADRRPEQLPATAPSDEVVLPPDLRHWLAELRAADGPDAVDENAYPPRTRDRIAYVVGMAGGRLVVEPVKTSTFRDGSLTPIAHPYDASVHRRGTWPRYVRPVDVRILHRIEAFGLDPRPWRYQPAVPPLPGEVPGLLATIARTGRGRFGAMTGPVLSEATARRATLRWVGDAAGSQRLEAVDEDGRRLVVLPVEPPVFIDPESGAIGELHLDAPPRLGAVLLKAPVIPPEAAAEVAEALSGIRAGVAPLPRALRSEVRAGIVPVPVLRLLAVQARLRLDPWSGLTSAFELPVLRLAFDYGGRLVAAYPLTDPRFREGDAIVTLIRDRAVEEAAHGRLEAAGTARLDELGGLAPSAELLDLDRSFAAADMAELAGVALGFMAEDVPELAAAGWRVEVDPSWPYRLHAGPVAIRAALDEGDGGWFSIGLTLDIEGGDVEGGDAGGQRLDLAPLILSIIAALPVAPDGTLAPDLDLDAFLGDLVLYQQLDDGSHVPIDAARLAPLVQAFLAAQGLLDGFHPAEAARVAELAEALAGCGVPFEGGEALVELGRRLKALATAPLPPPPAGFEATLRPYQQAGYGWLRAVAATGFGGVLADDMGLGKTVQALALLAHLHLGVGADRPSLLVAPTSLVGTWRREAARFVPGLKVLVLHGPDRHERFAEIEAHHLVVTTYPLLHRDHARLFDRPYELAILDEAQTVKNPASSAAKHIRKVEARTRLALTGTPVENNLQDLWTLFDWLIPGLLGNRKTFGSRFRQPIEKRGDQAAQARLNARIRPFVLRRTKAEVAADLPPRTEIVELVPLGAGQRGLYETIRLTMDERVRQAIARRGLAGSRITILDALLKLRQVCCDPALLPLDPDQPAGRLVTESAKLDRLMEMLEALVAEGRRVLVFSQFVKMLRLIEKEVTARGWDHAWLTGETKDRDAVVARFQAGLAPLFLISLKAGGVGLTLTAADTVILYDPWWNPAVERQAMDRAHRIGQDRPVFVYRLVAEGSVEEAITALQAKKQAMADALFEGEATGPLGLDEADLAELFRPLGPG